MKILVTGASGFIGRGLCPYLKAKDFFVRGAVRRGVLDRSGVDECVEVGDIDDSTDWRQALAGADVVVHLAALVHVMDSSVASSLETFRKVNVLGTERLARMAIDAGVKRFIFISSVKVNGEGSSESYSELDPPKPEDAYGLSKKEAEDALRGLARQKGLEVVILRLPLVYGPGAKANFKNLIKLVRSGMPMPFKSVCNKRSLICLGNVLDAIALCASHPLAANETFLVSDGEDVSTAKLMEMIARAMNSRSLLFPFPPQLLKGLCALMGKRQEADKLLGSLHVDSSKIRRLLGWNPPVTMQEGIKASVL
jgi:nucleoside-diphosphate-sugar epimerase